VLQTHRQTSQLTTDDWSADVEVVGVTESVLSVALAEKVFSVSVLSVGSLDVD